MSQIVTPPILSSNLSYLIPPNNSNVFSLGYGSSIITTNTTNTTTKTDSITQSNTTTGGSTTGGSTTGGSTTGGSTTDQTTGGSTTDQTTPIPGQTTGGSTTDYNSLKKDLKIDDGCDKFVGTTSGYYGLILTTLEIILIWYAGSLLLGRLPIRNYSIMVLLPIIYIILYVTYYEKNKNTGEASWETIFTIMIAFSTATSILFFLFGSYFLNTNPFLGGLGGGVINCLIVLVYNFVLPWLLFKFLKKERKEKNSIVNQMFVIIIVLNVLYFIVLVSFGLGRGHMNWSLLCMFAFWMVAYGLIYHYLIKKQQYTIDPKTPLKENWSIKFLYLKCFITFISIMLLVLFLGIFRLYGAGDIRINNPGVGNNAQYLENARIYFGFFLLNVIMNFLLLGILIHLYIRAYVCSKT